MHISCTELISLLFQSDVSRRLFVVSSWHRKKQFLFCYAVCLSIEQQKLGWQEKSWQFSLFPRDLFTYCVFSDEKIYVWTILNDLRQIRELKLKWPPVSCQFLFNISSGGDWLILEATLMWFLFSIFFFQLRTRYKVLAYETL